MIVENLLTYAGLVLIELMIAVQVHMILPTIKHVLICLSELRQLLSQLTNVHCHIQNTIKFCGYNTNTNHYQNRQC